MAPCSESAPLIMTQKDIELMSKTAQEKNKNKQKKIGKELKKTPILVEIIGATNLINPNNPEESSSLHPFVIARLHGNGQAKILRRTKRIKDTANPIWCIEHRCLFVLDVSLDMVRISRHALPWVLEFEVRNKDASDPLSCTYLGSVSMDMSTVLQNCTEERQELDLEALRGGTAGSFTGSFTGTKRLSFNSTEAANFKSTDSCDNEENKSKIAVRFRVASEMDLRFMDELDEMERKNLFTSFFCDRKKPKSDSSLSGDVEDDVTLMTEKNERKIGVNGVLNALNYSFRNTKTDSQGIVRLRVKPEPDPCRMAETTYLSHDELDEEVMKPSTNWIAAGEETSESLGKVYLEILKCENLPNMDSGEALGNKTDAFVCAIFEDSMTQTDVIDDKLSPFWLPWTKRAFVFQITHAFSQLFISANDYDVGPGKHDGIGRIAINLNHFKNDVLYTLKYKLYPECNTWYREALGTITIRLRKEIKDEKKFLLASLKPYPRFHINMRSRKSLPVANFTTFGMHNEDHYDVKILRCYVNEMIELKRFFYYAVEDTFKSLILWRGQVKVGDTLLPLHSAIAFFGSIYVIEHPHLLPGCFFLSIAWIMLASLNNRIEHPSPWHRSFSFLHYLNILIHGKSTSTLTEIKSMEGHEETMKFEANWANRMKTDLDAINHAWSLQQEMDRIGNEDLQTEEKKTSTDPLHIALSGLSSRLFPIQKMLRRYCTVLRRIKSVATWEENMLSFWVTLPCLVIGTVLLIIPSVFIIHWLCRIFIWVCLGPWFRIYCELCVFEHNHSNPLNLNCDESRNKYSEKIFEKIAEQFQEKERIARLKGEEAIKMKAMRIIRFGKHIAKVPPNNLTRHYDFPLTQSKASHITFESEHQAAANIPKKIIPSQRLEGQMIPMTEQQLMAFSKSLIQSQACCNSVDQDDNSVPESLDSKIGELEPPFGNSQSSEESQISDIDDMKESEGEGLAEDMDAGAPICPHDWVNNTFEQLNSSLRAILTTTDEPNDPSMKANVNKKHVHFDSKNLAENSKLTTIDSIEHLQDDNPHEEGVEIVAWIQEEKDLSLISVKDDSTVRTSIEPKVSLELDDQSETSLSTLFQSSSSTYMAFCRS